MLGFTVIAIAVLCILIVWMHYIANKHSDSKPPVDSQLVPDEPPEVEEKQPIKDSPLPKPPQMPPARPVKSVDSLFPEYADVLRAHNVRYLVHFTNASNLENIFTFGLLSRNRLSRLNISHICSDTNRYDGNDNICLSVEFPNYKMFYAKRNQYQYCFDDWAVLCIDANILTERRAKFYVSNAASSNARPLTGVYGFERLFSGSSRPINLPQNFPTDPQAEVQIEDQIPSEYIRYVFFENDRVCNKYREFVPPTVRLRSAPILFKPREEYVEQILKMREEKQKTGQKTEPMKSQEKRQMSSMEKARLLMSAPDTEENMSDTDPVLY